MVKGLNTCYSPVTTQCSVWKLHGCNLGSKLSVMQLRVVTLVTSI